jgi:hypothetical protein
LLRGTRKSGPGLNYLALSAPIIVELLSEGIDFALLGIKPMRSHDYRPGSPPVSRAGVRLNDFDNQNQSLADLISPAGGFTLCLDTKSKQKNQEKNKLPPALDFLFGSHITTVQTGKSIHAITGPHFFRANALIPVLPGFWRFVIVPGPDKYGL